MPALPNRLPRSALIAILFGLVSITALSWWYMFYLANNMEMAMMDMAEMNMAGMDMAEMDRNPMTGMDMPVPAHQTQPAPAAGGSANMPAMSMTMHGSWSLTDFVANFIMWAVMMVAMMVPSASPTILLYARLQRDQNGRTKIKPVTLFLTGYLLAWTGFSLGASLLQWGLHEAALMGGGMAIENRWIIATLLLLTGIYQWSPLKQACLKHCQSPLGFLFSFWREHPTGIIRMGWRHGLYCVGCCWLLMLILFAVGVMNLLAVALIAGYVLLEKLLPIGPRIAQATGTGFLIAAVVVIWPTLTN